MSKKYEYEKDWKSFVKNANEIEEASDPLPQSTFQKNLFKTQPKAKKELIGQGIIIFGMRIENTFTEKLATSLLKSHKTSLPL